MSQENVEIVRGIWEADRRRDVAAVLAAYAPDVEWEDNTGLWGDWGTARGPDGIQAAWRRWHEAFEEVQFEWDEVVDGGDDVVVTYRTHGRGRGSGVVVDQAITLLWTLRAGKVVHVRAYPDRADALEAAELRDRGQP
ncbi:MAG: nuclear transport factor 2 family protein [Solirubrobacterales bacterium]